MSRFYGLRVRCGVCREKVITTRIMSTVRIGNPDLDFRPPIRYRNTIFAWIQRCPRCGYCAPAIAIGEKEVLKPILMSDEYRQQLNSPDFPELANSFLCYSIIAEKGGDLIEAGYHSLYAAWVCDDLHIYSSEEEKVYNGSARRCRLRALELFQRQKERNFRTEIIEIDLLRRTGDFENAIIRCKEVYEKICNLEFFEKNVLPETEFMEEDMEEDPFAKKKIFDTFVSILKLQEDLSRRHDTDCYTIDDAMERYYSNSWDT